MKHSVGSFSSSSQIDKSTSFRDVQSNCPQWRAPTLKKRFLVAAAALSFSLAGFLLALQYIDNRNGALFYAVADDNFSIAQSFIFRYLPNILVVAYGIIITAIDLDAKRLEPWYLLSSSNLKAGKQAMTMTYDVDFIGYTIIKALRHGHWNIVLSSIMLVFATIVIPAVQNAMFSTGTASIKSNIVVPIQPELISVSQQVSVLSSNFLNTAYAYQWLGQALPPFTSAQFAIAPFANISSMIQNGPRTENMFLSASTLRYWTELDCFAPTSHNASDGSIAFDDGQGCDAQDLVRWPSDTGDLESGKYKAYYIGYARPEPIGSTSLTIAGCKQPANKIFAAWTSTGMFMPDFDDPNNATALFCESSYFVEPVIATVKFPGASIVSFKSTGQRQELDDSLFNRTHFESIIVRGQPADTTTIFTQQINNDRDFADAARMQPDARLRNMSLAMDTPAMIGFAVGSSKLEPRAYFDPDTLQSSLRAAHQLVFVMAISEIFNSSGKLVEAERLTSATAVQIVTSFTVATVVLMGVVGSICVFLAWHYQRKRLQLSRNPESLATVAYIGRRRDIQNVFGGSGIASETELQRSISNFGFNMNSNITSESLLQATRLGETECDMDFVHSSSDATGSQAFSLPLEISWFTVGTAVFAISTSLVTLIGLYYVSIRSGGLSLPTKNRLGQQVILNLIPTAFSAMIAAYLTLVCRVAAFLSPLEDLNKEKGALKDVLQADYTSVPPQLVFLSALRNRKWGLAYLSTLTILVNVLTVTMASMFNISNVQGATPISIRPVHKPIVNAAKDPAMADMLMFSYDAYYVAVPNATNTTTLPPWTIPEYSFLPINFSQVEDFNAGGLYSMEMTGYGADLECENLLETSEVAFELSSDARFFRLQTSVVDPSGSVVRCQYAEKPMSIAIRTDSPINAITSPDVADDDYFNSTMADQGFNPITGDIFGNQSFEISKVMTTTAESDTPGNYGLCRSQIVKGWVRGRRIESVGQQPPQDGTVNSFNLQHEETILGCRPRLRSRDFTVLVAGNGSIFGTWPLTDPAYELPTNANFSHTVESTTYAFNNDYDWPLWHNDAIARDYFNYYGKRFLSNTRYLDADQPPPEAPEAMVLMSELYARLFAVQLSLSTSMLEASDDSAKDSLQQVSSGVKITSEQRVTISAPMFVITEIILGLSLIGLLAFRFSLAKPFLPRMPFTIASQLAYFSGSRAMTDMVNLVEEQSTHARNARHVQSVRQCAGRERRNRSTDSTSSSQRYGFGKFVGTDGKMHVGIERKAFVTRISGSLDVSRQDCAEEKSLDSRYMI